MILTLIFLIFSPSHFALCYSLINVNSPGAHNFVITSDNLVQINIPESFQAFVFSNIDMGKYNAFSVGETILPPKYRNMFAIAFNSSSRIFISTIHDSKQNMVVFIIPDHICDQHSFYAMSKKVFKTRIKTKSFNHNIKACGFSPSFITDSNMKVSFGYKNEIKANALLFYGFTSTSQKNSLKNSTFEKVYKKLNQNLKSRSKYIKPHNNLINKLNLFIKKDKVSIQKNDFLNTNSNIESIGPNIITNSINSPGFQFTHSVESEAKTFDDINTTYYVSYTVNQPNVGADIIFERSFENEETSDNSMLSKHCDFLVYYDKNSSTYIYDKNWSDSIEINYLSSDDLKFMKWIWISIIVLFVILVIIISIRLICILKRKCLSKRNAPNLDFDDDEFEQPDYYSNANRARNERRSFFSSPSFVMREEEYEQTTYHNLNDLDHYNNNNASRARNEFETFCYSPNLDDEILYENESSKNKKSKSGIYSNQNEFNEGESIEEIGNKKCNQLDRNKSSISKSPYSINESQCNDVDDVVILSDIENNNEEILNPYGLPYISNEKYSDVNSSDS